jgi:hypothetical protein
MGFKWVRVTGCSPGYFRCGLNGSEAKDDATISRTFRYASWTGLLALGKLEVQRFQLRHALGTVMITIEIS